MNLDSGSHQKANQYPETIYHQMFITFQYNVARTHTHTHTRVCWVNFTNDYSSDL